MYVSILLQVKFWDHRYRLKGWDLARVDDRTIPLCAFAASL